MTGAVILAAGSSSRLGQPKQQLQFKGKTLLQHAVDAALQASCKPVIVVLGSQAEIIQRDIADRNVKILVNDEWQTGMGASIKTGLTEIIARYTEVTELVLMVCDQPFTDANLLKQLIETKKSTAKEIVACKYGDTVGVPAIFDKIVFNELVGLKGQEGAKQILTNNKYSTSTILFLEGTIDIDTTEDYNKIQGAESRC